MLRHILVPLDGSPLAEAVLPAAAAMAQRFAARLTLFHVIETGARGTVHGDPHLTDAAAAQTYLNRIAKDPRLAGCTVDVHLHRTEEKDVAASAVNHAEELDADLIAMAAHGGQNLRTFLFGRVGLRAVKHGTTPVLLVRPNSPAATAFRCRTILVALDGTSGHELSVPVAAAMAKAFSATVTLVTVVPTAATLAQPHSATATLLPSATRHLLDMAEEQTQAYLREIESALRADSIPVSTAVRRGDPATTLGEAVKDQRADLVVMASHGKGPLEAFWSGSLTPKVMETLEPPLLLVRAPREAQSAGEK